LEFSGAVTTSYSSVTRWRWADRQTLTILLVQLSAQRRHVVTARTVLFARPHRFLYLQTPNFNLRGDSLYSTWFSTCSEWPCIPVAVIATTVTRSTDYRLQYGRIMTGAPISSAPSTNDAVLYSRTHEFPGTIAMCSSCCCRAVYCMGVVGT
jgi:hypothetical protein